MPKKIAIPSLVLTGQHDERVPIKDVELMAKNFSNLQGYHVFDEGHRPFAESHPDLWRERVSRFLTDL